jgi:hypothetical protein
MGSRNDLAYVLRLVGVRRLLRRAGLGAALGVVQATLLGLPIGSWALLGALVSLLVQVRPIREAVRLVRLRRHFLPLAAARGWRYHGQAPLRVTRLLRQGDMQLGRAGFDLAVAGVRARLYEHVRVDGMRRRQPVVFGIQLLLRRHRSFVVLAVPVTVPGVPRLRLRRRGAVGGAHPFEQGMSALELESSELARDFELLVDRAADPIAVRRLFSPALIARILDFADDSYLGDALEVENGWLVLASPGTIEIGDAPALDRCVAVAEPLVAAFVAASRSRASLPVSLV